MTYLPPWGLSSIVSKMAALPERDGPSVSAPPGAAHPRGHDTHRVERTHHPGVTSQGRGTDAPGGGNFSRNADPTTGGPHDPHHRGFQGPTFIPSGPTILLREHAMTTLPIPTNIPLGQQHETTYIPPYYNSQYAYNYPPYTQYVPYQYHSAMILLPLHEPGSGVRDAESCLGSRSPPLRPNRMTSRPGARNRKPWTRRIVIPGRNLLSEFDMAGMTIQSEASSSGGRSVSESYHRQRSQGGSWEA